MLTTTRKAQHLRTNIASSAAFIVLLTVPLLIHLVRLLDDQSHLYNSFWHLINVIAYITIISYCAWCLLEDFTSELRTRAWFDRKVLENITEGVMVTDANQIIQSINPAFTAITGYREVDIRGQTPRILSSGEHTREFYQTMWESIHEKGIWHGDICNRRKNGEKFIEHITITAVKENSGHILCYIAVFKDITIEKQLQDQLKYQAFHDNVTGLPNRALLSIQLDQALNQAKAASHIVALLFLDLDRFKRINDTLGHAAGDMLLRMVADRLKIALRPIDTIARIGGDEFMIILTGLTSITDSILIAQEFIYALTSPFYIEDNELYITVSIGISHYPHDDVIGSTLIKYADQAMYVAKQQGRNNYYIYKPKATDHSEFD